MKKYFLVAIAFALSTTLFSCSKISPNEGRVVEIPAGSEDQLRSISTNSELPDVSCVVLDGVNTLRFGSDGDVKEFADYCLSMSSEDAVDFVRQTYNVTPYLSWLFDYYRELQTLDRISVDKEEAVRALSLLTSKYASKLLFDEENIAYSDCKREDEALVANINGKYIVGGEVRSITRLGSFEEIRSCCVKSENVPLEVPGLRANNAYARTRDRKAILRLSYNPLDKEVLATFTAQIKILFGLAWNSYNTTYSGRLQIKELSLPFWVYGQPADKLIVQREINNSDRKQVAPFLLEAGKNYILYIDTNEEAARFTLRLGRFKKSDSNSIDGREVSMKGLVEVWSRGISFEERGKDEILIDHGSI